MHYFFFIELFLMFYIYDIDTPMSDLYHIYYTSAYSIHTFDALNSFK